MSQRYPYSIGPGVSRLPPQMRPQPMFANPLEGPQPRSVFANGPGSWAEGAQGKLKRNAALAYGAKELMDRISLGEGTAGDAGYDTTFDHKERVPGVGLPTQKTLNEWQGDYGDALAEHGGKRIIGKAQFAPNTMGDIRRNMRLTGAELGGPDLQDRMYREVLHMAGYDDYLDGNLTTDEFAQRLAGRFASVAKKNGKSHHEGQPVGTTYEEIVTAIKAAEAEARRQGYKPGERGWR
jgi:hypothetical protein